MKIMEIMEIMEEPVSDTKSRARMAVSSPTARWTLFALVVFLRLRSSDCMRLHRIIFGRVSAMESAEADDREAGTGWDNGVAARVAARACQVCQYLAGLISPGRGASTNQPLEPVFIGGNAQAQCDGTVELTVELIRFRANRGLCSLCSLCPLCPLCSLCSLR